MESDIERRRRIYKRMRAEKFASQGLPVKFDPVLHGNIQWPIADRVEAAQERAAIMEYDGGYDREHAERYAAQQWAIPVEWLR